MDAGRKKGGDGSGLKTGEGAREETGTEKEVEEARVYVLLMTKGVVDVDKNDVDTDADLMSERWGEAKLKSGWER